MSNHWEPTNIFIKSTDKNPEDCFDTYLKHKIYRNTCCTACRSGQWLNEKINECIDCKAGHKCPSTLDASQNVPCDPGSYQPEPRKTSCRGSRFENIHQIS